MKDYTSGEKIKAERKRRQQKDQYEEVASLGWKGFGLAFLIIVVAIVLYAIFF